MAHVGDKKKNYIILHHIQKSWNVIIEISGRMSPDMIGSES